jgi:hypothetical protein
VTVEPEIDEAEYRMREQLGEATIEGESVEISINIDGKAVFFDFPEKDVRLKYNMTDLLAAAYEKMEENQCHKKQ